MKAEYGAVFALLLAGMLSAGQLTVYFFPEPTPFNNLNGSFAGHYGNYTVISGVSPPFPYITIYGKDATQATLASELEYLKNSSLLVAPCDSATLVGADGTDFICTPEGWNICPKETGCAFGAPEAAPQAPQAQDVLGIMAANSRAAKTGGEANAATGTALGATPPAADNSAGVKLEQILQLAGALIAVVVASYLVLQQRPEPIDPREEKLLENETRAGIMQELSGADRIPTDLSHKLGKSKATVVEHLTALTSVGFVERVSTPGKKYVFYRLTQKGKRALLKRAG